MIVWGRSTKTKDSKGERGVAGGGRGTGARWEAERVWLGIQHGGAQEKGTKAC